MLLLHSGYVSCFNNIQANSHTSVTFSLIMHHVSDIFWLAIMLLRSCFGYMYILAKWFHVSATVWLSLGFLFNFV